MVLPRYTMSTIVVKRPDFFLERQIYIYIVYIYLFYVQQNINSIINGVDYFSNLSFGLFIRLYRDGTTHYFLFYPHNFGIQSCAGLDGSAGWI